jgi:hypothetical protein
MFTSATANTHDNRSKKKLHGTFLGDEKSAALQVCCPIISLSVRPQQS